MKPLHSIAVIAILLFADPAAATIQGHSTVSNCGEAGNWIDLTFTADGGVTLVDAWWDFNATSVWLDADGTSLCSPLNIGNVDYDFYFDGPIGVDTQDFGLTAQWFDSGDTIRFIMDLDVGGGGSPFTSHYEQGTVTVEFSDGTVLTAAFDDPYDSPNGARASFVSFSPALPNYTVIARSGWAGPLVPRAADDASAVSVPAPTTLTGDTEGTWINGTVYNGSGVVAGAARLAFHLDGGPLFAVDYLFDQAPHTYAAALNRGPYEVTGGRHVIRMTADALDVVTESDETDNVHAVQWGWAGSPLPVETSLVRAAPPPADADLSLLAGGAQNCDGVRVTPGPGSTWSAVWCAWSAVPQTSNYRLRRYATSDDPATAYLTALAESRGGDGLQCLLFNNDALGGDPRDIGIVNIGGAERDYRIGHDGEYAADLWFETGPTGPYVRRHVVPVAFDVAPGDLGPVTVVLRTDPLDGPLRAGILGPAFTQGGLDDLEAVEITEDGVAKVQFEAVDAGRHALVVYAEPSERTAFVDFDAGLYHGRPDLEPVTQTGWCAPIVARPAPDAALFSCALPETLHGEAAATWLNLSYMNSGNDTADTLRSRISVDGVPELTMYTTWNPLVGGAYRSDRNIEIQGEPWTMSGGRHTVAFQLDYLDEETESREDNNRSGRQYCWSPAVLPPGGTLARAAVPDRSDGWDECEDGTVLYYNCDGLRLQSLMDGSDARWRAVAVAADHSAMDLDLELHEPLVGADGGFGPAKLEESHWSEGHIDFILVHDPTTGTGPLDAGVHAGVLHHLGGYTAEASYSEYIAKYPQGPLPSRTMPAGRMLDLWEVALDEGPVLITVANEEGTVDWGLSVYARGDIRAKAETLPGGLAWDQGEGQAEAVLVDIPARDNYCIAVWKTDNTELGKEGSYRLSFAPDASSAPTTPPVVAAGGFRNATPNPFNPTTVISFDLPRPETCVVTLHDLQGRAVRRLHAGPLPAGRNSVIWDATDDRGRRVASGIYMARLAAPSGDDLLKVTLLK